MTLKFRFVDEQGKDIPCEHIFDNQKIDLVLIDRGLNPTDIRSKFFVHEAGMFYDDNSVYLATGNSLQKSEIYFKRIMTRGMQTTTKTVRVQS